MGTAARSRNWFNRRIGSSASVPRLGPHGRRMSKRRDSPARTVIPDWLNVPYWQQGMTTARSKVPGGSAMEYSPFDEPVPRTTALLAVFLAWISASLTMPPSGSMMVPVIVPVCARATALKMPRSRANVTDRDRNMLALAVINLSRIASGIVARARLGGFT